MDKKLIASTFSNYRFNGRNKNNKKSDPKLVLIVTRDVSKFS